MILELKITFFIPISMVVNIILHLKKFLYNFASLNREIFLKLEDVMQLVNWCHWLLMCSRIEENRDFSR